MSPEGNVKCVGSTAVDVEVNLCAKFATVVYISVRETCFAPRKREYMIAPATTRRFKEDLLALGELFLRVLVDCWWELRAMVSMWNI